MQKILLVEDNEMNRDMLSRRLRRAGFDVCCAADGETALVMACGELPSVILMDVALGEMDGWETTKFLKKEPQTKDIPVIALTAHALKSDRDKSFDVGCADFDTKPIDMMRLLGKINACLSN